MFAAAAQRGFEIRLIAADLQRSKPESKLADKACLERGRREYPPHIKASSLGALGETAETAVNALGYTAANANGPLLDCQTLTADAG